MAPWLEDKEVPCARCAVGGNINPAVTLYAAPGCPPEYDEMYAGEAAQVGMRLTRGSMKRTWFQIRTIVKKGVNCELKLKRKWVSNVPFKRFFFKFF